MKFKKKNSIFRSIVSSVIYTNDAINICYEASKNCVAGKLSYDTDTRHTYISKRVKDEHESILEHSNVVMLVQIPDNNLDDLSMFLASCRYLNTILKHVNNIYYLLIGGSIRGYKNLIKDMYDQTNKVLKKVKYSLSTCVPPAFLLDLIDDAIYNMYDFTSVGCESVFHLKDNPDFDSDTGMATYMHTIPSKNTGRIEFVNVDPVDKIYNKIKAYGFNLREIISICSVTIKFCNMSRIITQELTRHRNGITQQSQRYISSSGIGFNTPDGFKPDVYDNNHVYGIDLKYPDLDESIHMDLTMSDLSKVLIPIYDQLMNQGLLKEDARYFLPQNTHSTVYMTFTVRSLLEFIHLRCDLAAQAELRMYAEEVRDCFMDYWTSIFGKNDIISSLESFRVPAYKYSEIYSDSYVTEEPIGELEEVTVEQTQAIASPEALDEDDDAPDFGLRKEQPRAIDKSDKAAEELYRQYNPAIYADTRLPEEEL